MSSERDWLIVGHVDKPHGVHGDLLVEIITDFPERLAAGVRFGAGPAEGPDTFHEVHRVRVHAGRWLLSVTGLRDRDEADTWRGRYLFLPEQSRDELPEGYYYEHHLVGLQCRSPEGRPLGTVVGLDAAGGQSRIEVERDGHRYLVPFVPELVEAVDLDGGTVTIRTLPGLLDDDAETA